MTYIAKEIIDNLNDLKQCTIDGDNSIIYVQIENKIYTVEEIKLNEDKEITLECEFNQYLEE